MPPVVAALEFDDTGAAGCGTREAQCVEGGLRTGAGQQNALERWDEVDEPFGQLDLDRCDATTDEVNLACRGIEGGVDVWVGMAEEDGAERGVVIGKGSTEGIRKS